MGGGQAGGSESQHEHCACQQIPGIQRVSSWLLLASQRFSLLGHIEAEASLGGVGGEVVIPRLLGHHDQAEVDLDTGR